MNIIKESSVYSGANEIQFLQNTMLNLLAANEFGKLMSYNEENGSEDAAETKFMADLLNDTQQNELY